MRKLKIVLIAAAALSMSLAASAQSKWGETPEDSVACISNVSLYQEFYKQKSYTDCYEPWRQILLHCRHIQAAAMLGGVQHPPSKGCKGNLRNLCRRHPCGCPRA